MTTPLHVTHKEITPAQFEEALQRYAEAGLKGLEINKAIEAEMNEVLSGYQDELRCVEQTHQQAWNTIREYCAANKKKIFGSRRSLGTPFGRVGFRLGTPRLMATKGTDWKQLTSALQQRLPQYIRTTAEPAKDLLLADYHKENVAPVLQELGVKMIQEELFYIHTHTAA